MANPVITALTADAWVKVATNITTGRFITKLSGPSAYLYTYVDTGTAAPTDLSIADMIDKQVEFNNSVGADFYIYANGAAGSVEAQL